MQRPGPAWCQFSSFEASETFVNHWKCPSCQGGKLAPRDGRTASATARHRNHHHQTLIVSNDNIVKKSKSEFYWVIIKNRFLMR
jgi:hypothetical protein